MINAIANDNASPLQNLGSEAVTSKAFGIMNSIVLSTSSIVAIEAVSVAAVILMASFVEPACFLTPRYVSA